MYISFGQMLKLQADIRAEIEALQMARRQLEFHIERTELWMENVGQWQAQIYNSEVGTCHLKSRSCCLVQGHVVAVKVMTSQICHIE